MAHGATGDRHRHRRLAMAIDSVTPQSRRTLLAGLTGGLIALVAQALGRPGPVEADGETVKVGGEYLDSRSRTFIKNSSNDADVLVLTTVGSGRAVYGKSTNGPGVEGQTVSLGGPGVYGWTTKGSAKGVVGENKANGNRGILGSSAGGAYGFSDKGIGVFAIAGLDGTALHVSGRASLSNSGTATIPAGADRTLVRLHRRNTANAFGLASLQQYRAGVVVAAAIPRIGEATLVIRLNKAVSSPTKVAFAVFESTGPQ
jgi:hypothetical protein